PRKAASDMYTDSITHYAVRQPYAPAAILPRGQLNYRQFERTIDAVARRLAEACRPGDRVGVVCGNLFLHWAIVLALGRLPVTSVSVSAQSAAQLLPHAGTNLVVAEPEALLPNGSK